MEHSSPIGWKESRCLCFGSAQSSKIKMMSCFPVYLSCLSQCSTHSGHGNNICCAVHFKRTAYLGTKAKGQNTHNIASSHHHRGNSEENIQDQRKCDKYRDGDQRRKLNCWAFQSEILGIPAAEASEILAESMNPQVQPQIYAN